MKPMILIIIELVIVIIGLALTPVLFYHFPRLPEVKENVESLLRISVIIPARNEEKNLALLLEDLCNQSIKPFEIICVDDESSDATTKIAESYGARVISLHNKPEGWTGKTWACQNGANFAKGELLLFLDADIRLGRNGILRLIKAYSESGRTISVQPFHCTERLYEQFSLPFNLIQIAANGTTLCKQQGVGLYGPIILISKVNYNIIGGHESVRRSVVEDMALGERLKEAGIPYQLFIGDQEISFRMYREGIHCLFQGWIKNIASGAGKTSKELFWMVFLWVASMTSVPLHMVLFAINKALPELTVCILLYVLWAVILYILSKKVGRFRIMTIIFYPVLVIGLISIFVISQIKRIFGLSVIWKGRAIGWEDKA